MAKSWTSIARGICDGYNSRSGKKAERSSCKNPVPKAEPESAAAKQRDYVAGKNRAGQFKVETRSLARKK